MKKETKTIVCEQSKGVNKDRLMGNHDAMEIHFMDLWVRCNRDENMLLNMVLETPCSPSDPDYENCAENILGVKVKRPLGEISDRDRVIADSVIQWLGSEAGVHFIQAVLNAGEFSHHPKHADGMVRVKKVKDHE